MTILVASLTPRFKNKVPPKHHAHWTIEQQTVLLMLFTAQTWLDK